MASVTRSTRRGEPSHHPSSPQQQRKKLHQQHDSSATNMHSRTAVLHKAPNGGGGAGGRTGRTKRGLDEPDIEAVKHKRSRFSVEILAKPRVINHAPPADKAALASGPAAKPTTTTTSATPNNTATVANNENTIEQLPNRQQKQSQDDPPTTSNVQSKPGARNISKNQSKIVNGMKHELDRLKPKPNDTKTEGRKLRSQEATKFKSELAAYFPDYDEVIGNEEKQQRTCPRPLMQTTFRATIAYAMTIWIAPLLAPSFSVLMNWIDLLNVDTPILITNTSTDATNNPIQSNNAANPFQPPFNATGLIKPRGYGDELFTSVWGAQVIDLSFLEPQLKLQSPDDPLPDSLFVPVHKRAERVERSIRNTEKGRAQHEKDRIIHLLEGLQGHDWLRVMGVSGVTETKKKEYQPARQYFIKGCQGILDKFRNWTLEEKRRKMEKVRALAEQAGENTSDNASEDEEESEGEDVEIGEDVGSTGVSETSSPAKQLREEALARSKLPSKKIKQPRGSKRLLPPPKPVGPPKEFKSFFSKKYERDAALAPRHRTHNRRGGRKVLAWGHLIPEFAESDFMLPAEYRDEETLKMRARKKRREKRNSGL